MFGGMYTRLCRLIEVGSWSQVSQRHLPGMNWSLSDLKGQGTQLQKVPEWGIAWNHMNFKSWRRGFIWLHPEIHARYEDLCISYWWCVLGRPQANVWHQKVEGFAKAGAAVLSLRAWQVILGESRRTPRSAWIWMENGNQRFSQNSKGILRGFQDGSGCVFLF